MGLGHVTQNNGRVDSFHLVLRIGRDVEVKVCVIARLSRLAMRERPQEYDEAMADEPTLHRGHDASGGVNRFHLEREVRVYRDRGWRPAPGGAGHACPAKHLHRVKYELPVVRRGPR